jgi:hypothetical protein
LDFKLEKGASFVQEVGMKKKFWTWMIFD